jgi:hypothetical protein
MNGRLLIDLPPAHRHRQTYHPCEGGLDRHNSPSGKRADGESPAGLPWDLVLNAFNRAIDYPVQPVSGAHRPTEDIYDKIDHQSQPRFDGCNHDGHGL